MWPLNYLSNWILDKRVLKKLKGTGFDTLRGFNRHLCLNIPLTNVLIRRYNADTRSFILGSAENPFNLAFGLEDVLYLTGLPIDGKPVTGVDLKDTQGVCQRYLGKNEGYSYGRNSSYIALSWLKENFMTLEGDDENIKEEVLAYHVRAYVLYVIGCIFAPRHGWTVSSVFLPLLENVDDIGSYAWGAALLANIHDFMENPTKHSVLFHFPLMIFAYIRFPGLSSTAFKLDPVSVNAFPLVVSWSHALGLVMRQGFENHDEENLETFFNNLKEEGTGEKEVKWRPYADLSSNFLPQHLREQVVLSKSRTILICLDRAVYHRPDKCQRQLGLAGHVLKGVLIEIKTFDRRGRKGNNGKDWSKKLKYMDYISEWDKRFDLLIDRVANAAPDQAEAPDHTDRVENVAPIVVEAGSVNAVADVASLAETVVVDNQGPERVSFLAGLQKAAENTSVGVTAIASSFLNTERENSENTIYNDGLVGNGNDDDREAGHSTREKSKKRKKTSCAGNDSPSSWEDLSCEELAEKFSSAEKVVWKKLKQADSTNKELQQQIITLQSAKQALQEEKQKLEASDRQKDQALMQLQKNHLDEVSTLIGQLKQVNSTNKELESNNEALQAEKKKLEASNSQKDHALTQLQKNHLYEVSTLIGLLKQKDETLDSHLRSAQEATKKVEEMVASLDQERAAAILKYKASPRFAEECRIVMAPLLLHGCTLGVDDAKAPDLDIGLLANRDLYQRGQGDETMKRFKELADGQDIVAMYNPRSPAPELANAAPDQPKASDRHLIDVLLEANATPDQAKALDHTNGDENVAPIVAEAGSVNDDDASSGKTVVLLDNQDPEKDSCPFEEARRWDAMLIAEMRLEHEKIKEEIELYRMNFPEHEHVNQISHIQESVADLMKNNALNSRDHQSPAAKRRRVPPSTTDRFDPPLIIDIKSESDSDSDVSITDSIMDALVQ